MMRQQSVWGVLLCLVAACAAALWWRSAGAQSVLGQTDVPAALPSSSFLITFGMADAEPRPWAGEVLPTASQMVTVESNHFRAHEGRQPMVTSTGMKYVEQVEPKVPNDLLRPPLGWVCATRYASFHGPTTEWAVRGASARPPIERPSVLVRVHDNPQQGAIQIRTVNGDFRFQPDELSKHASQLFLNGQVRVETVANSGPVAEERLGQQDYPSIAAAGPSQWVAWQEWNGQTDAVLVRQQQRGVWRPAAMLTEGADVFRTAVAFDGAARPWVIWSMQVQGDWDLYGSHLDRGRWSAPKRLTSSPGSDIYHRAVTDSLGRLWLVWQRVASPRPRIMAKYLQGETWSAEFVVSEGPGGAASDWWPAIAAGPNGTIAIAWDGYAGGTYDVYLRTFSDSRWGAVRAIGSTARFEAHPSVAFDNEGRIWLAWDESGAEWGKDYGFLARRYGTALHETRNVRVVCLQGERLFEPQAGLDGVLGKDGFWELPHLEATRNGTPWLVVRHLIPRQPDTPSEAPFDGGLWELYATRLNGKEWSRPIFLPESAGRNEMMPATSAGPDGGLTAVWATDLRSTRAWGPHQLRIKFGVLPAEPTSPPALQAYTPVSPRVEPLHPAEAEQVNRIRGYRVQSRGRVYSIFRGDLHRHTDISFDGQNDGSLQDAYRYARDAAGMDFLGVSDHTDGAHDPYSWWRNQKFVDLFHVDGSFASLYGYERSVEYPNGHRNVFFLKRGMSITPINNGESQGFDGAESLFWYLRAANGISIPHTSARNSGTDWRDNDPKVENLVEIYQGFRDTYEYPGAPRPKWGSERNVDPSKPVPRASSVEQSASFRRLGFVWEALAKGYRLGFIASSDHISTHMSYACVLAENLTRESLWEAMRARRTYAATDNIIVDLRFRSSRGDHLMGEEFTSVMPVRMDATLIGTGAIRQVDIIKDGKIVYTVAPGQERYGFSYVDGAVRTGLSYLYVRVLQDNGEMAWSSPIWVHYVL